MTMCRLCGMMMVLRNATEDPMNSNLLIVQSSEYWLQQVLLFHIPPPPISVLNKSFFFAIFVCICEIVVTSISIIVLKMVLMTRWDSILM